MGPPRILFRPGTEELQETRAGLSEPPFLQVFVAFSCQCTGFPWRHHGHRYPSPLPILALSWACYYSYAPSPSLSLQFFLALEEFASIEEADREEVPAVALKTAPRAAFLVLRDRVQMKQQKRRNGRWRSLGWDGGR